MAPAIAIDPRAGKHGSKLDVDGHKGGKAEPTAAELRRRNEELEREVGAGREREDALRREMERARERLRTAEEAEERLCAQLGELEAEALAQAREYRLRVQDLSDQLDRARKLIASSAAAHPHHIVI